jgi:hypothetical protein
MGNYSVENSLIYTVYHISSITHRREAETKDCSLFHNLVPVTYMQRFNARKFVAVVTGNCILTIINLTLTKLSVYTGYRRYSNERYLHVTYKIMILER